MSTYLVPTSAAGQAWSRLSDALDDLAHEGDSTPCQRSAEAFTSDDPDLRAGATALCPSCPVADLCRSYGMAAEERWGVWGGIDRTPRGRAG